MYKFGRKHLHDRDVNFCEAAFHLTDVDLLELTVTDVFLLIGHTSLSASDRSRRKRGSEDEARSIGSDHVDEIIRASDVATDSTISLAQSS